MGSGCPTCQKLNDMVKEIITESGWDDVDYQYLTGQEGVQEIIQLGLMQSPVLTVNDQVAFIGFINDKNKIKDKICSALSNN